MRAAKKTSSFAVATRLHLGNASSPPDQSKLEAVITNFSLFATNSCCGAVPIIAVDATPKIEGYDYVQAVQKACRKIKEGTKVDIYVVPITPWNKFCPALNALVHFAVKEIGAEYICFVSAETSASKEAMQLLLSHAETKDTLVAGALLHGHKYEPGPNNDKTGNEPVKLSGRSTPWNTLAVWKLSKLCLTGFQLVSEGLSTDDEEDPSYGVEEVIAIALLQNVLGADDAKAKLVKLPHVDWNENFTDDERKKWHEKKMNSKIQRAGRQLEKMGLSGVVYHC